MPYLKQKVFKEFFGAKKTARDFLPLLKDKSVSIKKFQRYRKNNVSLFFCLGKNAVFQSISFLSNLELEWLCTLPAMVG